MTWKQALRKKPDGDGYLVGPHQLRSPQPLHKTHGAQRSVGTLPLGPA